MNTRRIELIFFDGCPNAEQARENLRAIPGVVSWVEWNLSSPDTPDRFRRYGSPTVLVDGRDVTGEAAPGDEGEAMSCRTDGAPSTAVIRRALERTAG
ncbi:MAG TPA: alkylmercury lyase [Gemmatimonadota bacterium]|nr:alkylmercury lyase [Gemmatimonadota bacterium]